MCAESLQRDDASWGNSEYYPRGIVGIYLCLCFDAGSCGALVVCCRLEPHHDCVYVRGKNCIYAQGKGVDIITWSQGTCGML